MVLNLRKLYVRRSFQGERLGRKLMENLFLKIRELGYQRVVLVEVATAKKPQKLYEATGVYEIEY